MPDILYCGDTNSKSAAAYLLGALSIGGYSYHYLNSDENFNQYKKNQPKLLILSDYPSKNISIVQRKKIEEWISSGTSFWMIGGWESFFGLNGEYTGQWSKLLPVIIKNKDDRVNSYQPYVLNPINLKHPILKNLPWQQAPSIGGFNLVKAKNGSEILMNAIPLKIMNKNGKISTKQGGPVPMLVKGTFGIGKTLALMTDLAPHWTGGFVDWGSKRIQAKGKDANEIEIGHLYAKFILQTVNYLIKK